MLLIVHRRVQRDPDTDMHGHKIVTLVKMLLEDRKAREDDMTWERERQEAAETRHAKQMAEQLEMMKVMLDRSLSRAHRGETSSSTPRLPNADKILLMKLTNTYDIEAFLTTFKRPLLTVKVYAQTILSLDDEIVCPNY